MSSLAHFCARVMDDHIFDISITMNFHFGPGILLITKGKSDVFETRSKTSPVNDGFPNRQGKI